MPLTNTGWSNGETEKLTLTRRLSIIYNELSMDGVLWRSRTKGGERMNMKLRVALVVLAVCAGWAVSACFG